MGEDDVKDRWMGISPHACAANALGILQEATTRVQGCHLSWRDACQLVRYIEELKGQGRIEDTNGRED